MVYSKIFSKLIIKTFFSFSHPTFFRRYMSEKLPDTAKNTIQSINQSINQTEATLKGFGYLYRHLSEKNYVILAIYYY